MADQTIDLDTPGKLWFTAEHEVMNTMHILLPEAKYTAKALTDDPTIDPNHQLMSPWSAAASDADGNGVLTLDLASSGKAKEIIAKLGSMFDGGKEPPKTVKAVVIAMAKDGNKMPPKQAAEVLEFDLARTHAMRVVGKARGAVDPLYVTAAAFKAGTKDFLIEITPLNIDEIEITTSVGNANLWAEGGAKATTLKLPVKDGTPIVIHCDVLFTVSQEMRYVYHPQITYAWDYWKPAYYDSFHREIMTGQEFTINLTGKSKGDPVVKAIKVRGEAWAASSDWMGAASAGPPNVYYHPHC